MEDYLLDFHDTVNDGVNRALRKDKPMIKGNERVFLAEALSNAYHRAMTLSGFGEPSSVKSYIILINETENSKQYLFRQAC